MPIQWQTVAVPLMYLSWIATIGVVTALVTIIRLIISGGSTPVLGGDDDYGLLRTVATVADLAHADEIRDRLARSGVRTTIAPQADGRVRVLVFADEYWRARGLT